jgi:hypothetical protein
MDESAYTRSSAIFENAVDSLRIGMEFFLKETSYSSRKHAILTVFHAIELLVKDRLAQTNPILIYKNIDIKITDDAQTVGVREALTRLENLGLGIPAEEKKTIETFNGCGTASSIIGMTITKQKTRPSSQHR